MKQHMKNSLIKCRKGYVMAICMANLLVISLLATNVLLILKVQSSQVELEKTLAYSERSIDEIGEQFLMGYIRNQQVVGGYTCLVTTKEISATPTDPDDPDPGYTLDQRYVLEVKTEGGETVLVVEKDAAGKIYRWSSISPEEESTT